MTNNLEQQLEWRTEELIRLREQAILMIDEYRSQIKVQNQKAKATINDAKKLLTEARSFVRGIGFFNYGRNADEAYALLSKCIVKLDEAPNDSIPEFEGLVEPVKYGNIDQTIAQLEKEAVPARHGMNTSKTLLYSNEVTGTAVYQVFTNNSNIIAEQGFGEHITWAYFLVGNNQGYSFSDVYVHSEARFSIGQIREDENNVVIPRSGTFTTYFEIVVNVRDLVFEKSKFELYETKGLTQANEKTESNSERK